MISIILSRIVIIVLGTLYPAYSSYKAVKTKNVKEYVKWMMYWIVFALFTCAEFFADIFLSWVPFYYEIKIVFVIWLIAPATKGSTILYKKFVHPQLEKREEEIDKYITQASNQGYSTLIDFGTKGLNYAANFVVATAIKGQSTLADQMKKSYSLNDLSTDQPDAFVRNLPDRRSVTVLDEENEEFDEDTYEHLEHHEQEKAEKEMMSQPVRPKRKSSRSREVASDEGEENRTSDIRLRTKKSSSKELQHSATLPRYNKSTRPTILKTD